MNELAKRIATLSPEHRARLAQQLKHRPAPKATAIPRRAGAHNTAPLSFAQERLWFLAQLEPDNPFYNVPGAVRLDGRLDGAALERGLAEIVRRHEVLRARLVVLDEQPSQQVDPARRLSLQKLDLSALPEEPWTRRVEVLMVEEALRPFDLAHDPLLRAVLVTGGPERHVLLLTMHHVVADAWSMGLLIRELSALYEAYSHGRASPLPEPSLQYFDYAHWQRDWLRGPVLDEHLAWWKAHLTGAPPLLELPLDHPRPGVQTYAGATRLVRLPGALRTALEQLCRDTGTTPFMVLMAAFNVLLQRYSGQDDICVGYPVAHRNRPELEGLIGCFINTLVLRTRLGGNPSFRELLAQTRESAIGAQAHQDLPFERLVEELNPVRDLGYSPLFQVMFGLLNAPMGALKLPGLTITPLTPENRVAKFDLSVDVWEEDDGLVAAFEYNTDLFEAATVERMGRHFETLLWDGVTQPDRRVSELRLLTPEEQRRMLVDWNATADHSFPLDQCYPQLFEAQVAKTPDAIAATCEGQSLSYAALNRRVNRLAHGLREGGAGPDTLIAILADRSLDFLVAVLAIFKAGGAYLPLEPAYPDARLAQVLRESRVGHVLASAPQADRAQRLTDTATPKPLTLFRLADIEAATPREDNPPPVVSPQNLAFVIFTSGSTGTPKGAMVEHLGMLNNMLTKFPVLGLTAGDAIAQTASQCFDISVWQFLTALLCGARVEIFPDDVTHDASLLMRRLVERGVTILEAVPSMIRALLDATEDGLALPRLRWLIPCGEAFPPELCRRWMRRYPQVALLNAYGPAECSDDVSYHRILAEPDEAARVVPVGRPVENTRLYLLDRHLQPVPVGVTGEICVAGVQVGRGYLNRPELTAKVFVPDPFGAPGERLYTTGDLARYRADGTLEFLGRNDHQVKIRGFRIELAEVEASLARHPDIRAAVALAREDRPGDKRLVAYLTQRAEAAPRGPADLIEELRAAVKAELPDYMVPAAFVFLDAFPLTPNGKLDRRALPAPDVSGQLQDRYLAPRSAAELCLADIWAKVLGVARVGVHDNFFSLGGDSILTIQVVSRATQAGLPLTPRLLFQHQTVAELAQAAEALQPAHAEQGRVSGPVPLTPIQRDFFERPFPNPHHWNQALLLALTQPLEPELIERALAELANHHDALRHRFALSADGWRQACLADAEPPRLERIDLRAVPPEARAEAIEHAANAAQAGLNLSAGPIWRALWFGAGTGVPSRLALVVHHLVMDGVSWRILLEDLHAACQQLTQGQAVRLPPKTVSFKTWAERLADHARSDRVQAEAAYWLDPRRSIARPWPVDHPDGSRREAASTRLAVGLSAAETQSLLREAPAAYRTDINDLLLAALATALCGWTRHDAVLVTLEGHGREPLFEDADPSRTVGWFTSEFPVLLAPAPDHAPGATLKAVKEQLRQVPGRGLGYGLLRYLGGADGAAAALAAQPAAPVVFNYLGQFDAQLPDDAPFALLSDSVGTDLDPDAPRSHELEIVAKVWQGQLQLVWHYSGERYQAATIAALAERYLRDLQALIAHCLSPAAGGYTPSDFPLAGLDQAALDAAFGGRRDIEDVYPLSPLQQGLLFHSLYEPDSATYFEQFHCRLEGDFQPDAFKAAWRRVLDRHEVLRAAVLRDKTAGPLQVIYRQVALPIEEQDWRSLSPAAQAERWEGFLAEDRRQGIDFSRAPLLRIALIRQAEQRWQFVWSHHHLLLDGWSNPLVLGDLFEHYAALAQGRSLQLPPHRPYRDYIAWLKAQPMAAAEAYWRERLAGIAAPTPLAFGRLESVATSSTNAIDLYHLPQGTTAALRNFAKQHRLTLNTLLQGAWALLLSRYSGQPSVVFGATVSGRPATLAGVETMTGLFINTLPMRVDVEPDTGVVPWLQGLLEQNASLRQFEFTPLVQVQGWSQIPRGQPLFESLLVFENYPMDRLLNFGQTGLTVRDVEAWQHTNYPLNLVITPGDSPELRLVYDARRFDGADIRRLFGHFGQLLESLIHHPDRRLGELSMVSAEERRQLLLDWSATAATHKAAGVLHGRFEACAATSPDALAVVCGEERLSYRALNRRANQVAHVLRESGVGRAAPVGVCLERSADLVVAILAILKAGGAYVPIDPDYPQDRVTYLLDDAKVAVLLTHAQMLERLPTGEAQTLCLDLDAARIAAASGDNLAGPIDPDQTAYVIYTSGSTGRPKGVLVSHRNAVHSTAARLAYYQAPVSAFLLLSSLAFDSSVAGLFWTLSQGGTLCLPVDGDHKEPAALRALIERERISHLLTLPSFYGLLLEQGPASALASLRAAIVAGEACPPDLIKRHHAKLGPVPLFNEYGPTEGSVWSTVHPLTMADAETASVSIGRPVPNVRAYVLDHVFEPVPVGVPGEIHLGGAGVARGYLDKPALTAERFLPDPFGPPGGRLYRTGDLARWRADGTLEFLGRIDQQVKIRGYRIELGEIEAVLAQHPAVREVAALARRDRPDDIRLVAYVVPQAGSDAVPPCPTELREFVAARLPDYMVPMAVVALEAFPLTPNGKLDRKALPAPGAALVRPEADAAPLDPVAESLAGLWAEVLGLERIGPRDNFFDVGGHSLLAFRVISRVQDEYGVTLPVAALFNAPTVAQFAPVVIAHETEPGRAAAVALARRQLASLSEADIEALLNGQG
jgi:amino acid adenylation domain-containing protein/non-ribosomal peptide synthase protein (TIGR01720 family)